MSLLGACQLFETAFVGDIVDARPILMTTPLTLFLLQPYCVLFTALNYRIHEVRY